MQALTLIGYVAFSVAVGWFWQQKGLSKGLGIVTSLLLSPLVGFIIGLVKKPDVANKEAREIATGGKRKCPFCAELIKQEAVVCRFCGKDLPAFTPPTIASAPRICSACEAPVNEGDKVCAVCGNAA